MKCYVAIFTMLFGAFCYKACIANDLQELYQRLNRINSFHAIFHQVVTDRDNILIQDRIVELYVKKPNLFIWYAKDPYINRVISDGSTVWLYDPEIKQVTAIWFRDIIKFAPDILIFFGKVSDLLKFNINKSGNVFVLKSKSIADDVKSLSITISPSGIIKSIKYIKSETNVNFFLNRWISCKVSVNKFRFKLPSNIILDDQRQ